METWYRDGDMFVVLETGMPSSNVEIGVGRTPLEAKGSQEKTPIQCVGKDSGVGAALRWAFRHDYISSADVEAIQTPFISPQDEDSYESDPDSF